MTMLPKKEVVIVTATSAVAEYLRGLGFKGLRWDYGCERFTVPAEVAANVDRIRQGLEPLAS
jgi:hypothetical protein